MFEPQDVSVVLTGSAAIVGKTMVGGLEEVAVELGVDTDKDVAEVGVGGDWREEREEEPTRLRGRMPFGLRLGDKVEVKEDVEGETGFVSSEFCLDFVGEVPGLSDAAPAMSESVISTPLPLVFESSAE